MEHLSDVELEAMAEARASEEELARARKHLKECVVCSARLAAREGATHAQPVNPELLAQAQQGAPFVPPEEPVLQRGETVGRYLILKVVGSGGMGVVYAAYDPELDRKVALKVLRANLGSVMPLAEGQARLLREAQAMARVSHPRVTTVHDVGTFGDQVFIAMELIEGTDLRQWLLEAKRPWRKVLDVMIAAGRGLSAAHKAGLVHRDFKPENVLVGRDGRVQVTDFGLARFAYDREVVTSLPIPVDLPDSDDDSGYPRRLASPLTQAGFVLGTPSYMAPEQHLGLPSDARSDQFSFCATLYYALFRKRAFDPKVLRKALEEASGLKPGSPMPTTFPRPPNGYAGILRTPPRDVRVPGWIKRALSRGLSIHPEDRFRSMGELLAHLSRPPATARTVQGAALVLVLAATGAFAFHTAQQRRAGLCSGADKRLVGVWDETVARRVEAAFFATNAPYAATSYGAVKSALDKYARAWAGMHKDACEATRIRGEQTEQMLSLRMMCLDRKLKELDATASLLGQADGKVVNRSVDVVQALSAVDACADVESLSTQVSLPEGAPAREKAAQISALLARAGTMNASARFQDALESARQAVAAARELKHLPLLGEALVEQGMAQVRIGDTRTAEQTLREAFTTGQRGRADEVCVRAATGLVYNQAEMLGKLDEARLWIELAEASLGRMGSRPDLELPLWLNEASTLYREGKYAEAGEVYARALALSERVWGHDSPQRLVVLNCLSVLENAQGNYARSAQVADEVLALSEKLKGLTHPQAALAHNTLALAYLAMGDAQKALGHAQQATSSLEASLGREHWAVASTLNTQASVLVKLSRFDEALALSRRGLEMTEKARGPKHPTLVFPLTGIGEGLLGLGKAREALLFLERAITFENPPPDGLADARFGLARALMQSGGDRERARSLAVLAREAYVKLHLERSATEAQRWLDAQPR